MYQPDVFYEIIWLASQSAVEAAHRRNREQLQTPSVEVWALMAMVVVVVVEDW